jgi:tRNA nucleotidyltransferase/poly(A) polymerase
MKAAGGATTFMVLEDDAQRRDLTINLYLDARVIPD